LVSLLCQVLAILCEDVSQDLDANSGSMAPLVTGADASAAAAASDGEDEKTLSGIMSDHKPHAFVLF
jgi:hypothetical protein